MESNCKNDLRVMFILYVLMFLGFGLRCNFDFSIGYVIVIFIVYAIFTILFINTYKISIDHEFIREYKIIGRNKFICLKDVYKIGVENMSWQIAKSYTLFIYTPERVYEIPASVFKVNELHQYLSELCKENRIDYYFRK